MKKKFIVNVDLVFMTAITGFLSLRYFIGLIGEHLYGIVGLFYSFTFGMLYFQIITLLVLKMNFLILF